MGPAGVYHQETVEVRFPRAETTETWIERMNRSGTAPLCACGCGGQVVVRAKHRSMGLPRYHHGHHPNPLRREFAKLRHKGYKLVGEVAKVLGVSQTTLRRMVSVGVLPKARRLEFVRGRCVRIFTAKEVDRIVRSKLHERWRAAHPGRWRRD